MATPIGTLGNVDTITIAGTTYVDLVNLIFIGGLVTAGNGASLRKGNGTAGYQVTAGKTLTLTSVQCTLTTAGTATLAYSDNDIGQNSATALTNPVYYFAQTVQFNMTSTGNTEQSIYFPVAATKYVTPVSTTMGGIFAAAGYEA